MRRYAKGLERRELLISVATEMLRDHEVHDISMHAIARSAGIPSASAYHFFDNPADLLSSVNERFGERIRDTIFADYERQERPDWPTLFRSGVDRAVQLYRAEPAYCRLILGAETTPAIKLADRDNDYELGRGFAEVIDRYFILPEIESRDERFFYAVSIVDLFLSLSYTRHGELRPWTISEANRAAIAYLMQFIPPELPDRDHENRMMISE